jgi:Anhydro-N-acetylmuramic acid kinase
MDSAIGLNRGSSFDGIDAVLIDIEIGRDGLPVRPKFKAKRSDDWPATVAGDVLLAFENKLTIFELCRLNYAVGAVYAECARSLMREHGVSAGDVEVIEYDGQTIYQEPADYTRLSQFFGSEDTTDVTQFRPSDHALGGSGAPLMQYLDFVAFRDIGPVARAKHRRHSKLSISGSQSCPDDGFLYRAWQRDARPRRSSPFRHPLRRREWRYRRLRSSQQSSPGSIAQPPFLSSTTTSKRLAPRFWIKLRGRVLASLHETAFWGVIRSPDYRG